MAAPPDQEQHQHRQRHADDAQIALHTAVLQPRQSSPPSLRPRQPSSKPRFTTYSSKPVEPGKPELTQGHQLHRAVPNPVVQPIANPRPPGVEADDRRLVDLVHEILVLAAARRRPAAALQHVGFLRRLARTVPAIEPPAQAKPGEDNHRGRHHQAERAAFDQPAEVDCRRFAAQETLEPRPGRRADKAEQNGKRREDDQRHGHDGGLSWFTFPA